MKILLCHNHYQQPGGEDQVYADEGWLLESHGHEVIRYTRHNDDVDRLGRLRLAEQTVYNRETAAELRELIARRRPDVMHCTNIFPLISPAAYDAAHEAGVPVVHSLHNYRLLCPGSLLLRNDRVCETCLGKRFPWPAVLHGCYRGDRKASAVVTAMNTWHNLRGTWRHRVDRFIALTHFARNKFIEGGLPAERITVKMNFVHPDPRPGPGGGGYALFVGRLTAQKGVESLLEAWQKVGSRLPLRIAGDGPLADRVRRAAAANPAVSFLGRRPLEEVMDLLGGAEMLVFPSVGHEHCPKTILESYAKGTPVVAAGLGAVAELVHHGRTGLHFTPGNPGDLAAKAAELQNSPDRRTRMRQAARAEYENRFTAEPNYRALMGIYEEVTAGGASLQPTAATRRHTAHGEPGGRHREPTKAPPNGRAGSMAPGPSAEASAAEPHTQEGEIS